MVGTTSSPRGRNVEAFIVSQLLDVIAVQRDSSSTKMPKGAHNFISSPRDEYALRYMSANVEATLVVGKGNILASAIGIGCMKIDVRATGYNTSLVTLSCSRHRHAWVCMRKAYLNLSLSLLRLGAKSSCALQPESSYLADMGKNVKKVVCCLSRVVVLYTRTSKLRSILVHSPASRKLQQSARTIP